MKFQFVTPNHVSFQFHTHLYLWFLVSRDTAVGILAAVQRNTDIGPSRYKNAVTFASNRILNQLPKQCSYGLTWSLQFLNVQSVMVRPICGLPFWFYSSVARLQTDFWGAGSRENAHTTSYHHWQLTSGWTLATRNMQTKKPKWQFRVANFVRSLFIGRSAAQHWGSRLSHLPSAAPVSDTVECYEHSSNKHLWERNPGFELGPNLLQDIDLW
jgi:hypothetical protein